MNRPDEATARGLLAAAGREVTLREPQPSTDVDGVPLGVDLVDVGAGVLAVSAAALGWPELAHLDDPEHPEHDAPPPTAA